MKRLRLQEIKDVEGGKKCLSPSIFRKAKAPFVLASGNISTTPSTSSESSGKSQATTGRKLEPLGPYRDL